MALTTADEVRALMPDTEMTDSQIDVFINMASVVLTSIFTGVTIDLDLRTILETWFTAHLMSSGPRTDRQARVEEIDQVKVTYSGYYDKLLMSTSYGQMVLTLDTTGTIAAKSGKRIVSMWNVTGV